MTQFDEAGVNIRTFHRSRRTAGGEAVLLLSVDTRVDEALLAKVQGLPGEKQVRALGF